MHVDDPSGKEYRSPTPSTATPPHARASWKSLGDAPSPARCDAGADMILDHFCCVLSSPDRGLRRRLSLPNTAPLLVSVAVGAGKAQRARVLRRPRACPYHEKAPVSRPPPKKLPTSLRLLQLSGAGCPFEPTPTTPGCALGDRRDAAIGPSERYDLSPDGIIRRNRLEIDIRGGSGHLSRRDGPSSRPTSPKTRPPRRYRFTAN